MVNVLLDTNVLSEFLHEKGPSPADEILDRIPQEQLFVSVISMGEIQKGISLLPPGRRQRDIEAWFQDIRVYYADQILPINIEIALRWGELSAKTRRAGENIAAADLLIAATALQHGLTVMTRNVRDFTPTGVLLINPWQDDIDEQHPHAQDIDG